ncbi:methyltransferase domain-containing protein [Sunxiuqinia sp. A32]|uniref:methyltransferase domain-containing protein n=1 Tax=Sunxiuqinia sp. A32 TaxID=3461496 RepID=UPI0040458C7E
MNQYEDPISRGVYHYYFKKKDIPVKIHSDGFDVDEVYPSYFYRKLIDMPALEQKALSLCKGKVLDVGACVGCHSTVLQSQRIDVVALELSELCCEVLKDRGIKQVVKSDIFDYEGETFDTILLLMNGTGIAGTLAGLDKFLGKLKKLLNPNGQILIDSSDLVYLYLDDDGSALIDLNANRYYGELIYQTEFQNFKGKPFPWLYVSKDILAIKANENGLIVDQVFEGEHFDYLARLIAK